MTIEEKEFKIEEGSTPARYDLYIRKVVNKGKKNEAGESIERDDWVLEGYDMSMPVIFTKLSHILTDKQLDKCKLKDYMKIYKESVLYLKELLHDC